MAGGDQIRCLCPLTVNRTLHPASISTLLFSLFFFFLGGGGEEQRGARIGVGMGVGVGVQTDSLTSFYDL